MGAIIALAKRSTLRYEDVPTSNGGNIAGIAGSKGRIIF
jgi:hypothetical protein